MYKRFIDSDEMNNFIEPGFYIVTKDLMCTQGKITSGTEVYVEDMDNSSVDIKFIDEESEIKYIKNKSVTTIYNTEVDSFNYAREGMTAEDVNKYFIHFKEKDDIKSKYLKDVETIDKKMDSLAFRVIVAEIIVCVIIAFIAVFVLIKSISQALLLVFIGASIISITDCILRTIVQDKIRAKVDISPYNDIVHMLLCGETPKT